MWRILSFTGCCGIVCSAVLLASSCRTPRIAAGKANRWPTDSVQARIAADSLFMEAQKDKITGATRQAIQHFEEYLLLEPRNPTAHYELSRLFGQLHNPAMSVQFASQAYHLDTANRWFAMAYADALVLNKQPDSAAELFAKLRARYPYQDEYTFNEGLLRARAGDYATALRLFNGLEQKRGTDEDIVYQKQFIYLKQGKVEAAAGEIRKLIAREPGEARYYGLLAQVYESQDMTDQAIRVYDTLLQRDPSNPQALVAIALHYKRKGDEKTYEKYMREAFSNPRYDIDDKIAFVYPFLKYVEIDSTKQGEALMLCRMILEAHPDNPRAHSLYGDMWFQCHQPDSALVQYRKAMALGDDRFELWQQLLLIYAAAQQQDSLRRISREVIRRFPDEMLGWYFNGMVHIADLQYEAGVQSLQKALGIGVKKKAVKSRIYASLGEAYHALGNYAASDTCFEQSLRLNPEDDMILNNYSYYLSERGDQLERAAQMSKAAIELDRDNYVYEDTYAWILFKMGKYREAAEWMEKVLRHPVARQYPEYLEHYGDILYKLRKVDNAVRYWQLAREKGAISPWLDQKIRERKLPRHRKQAR